MPSSSSKRRAQGGGRTPNSEPRLQVFRDFNGLNFEHSQHMPAAVDSHHGHPGDQTDLQMNYMFLQNNVSTTDNKTLETRDNIVDMFHAPNGVEFTGPVCMIGPAVYAAKDNHQIGVGYLDTRISDDPEVMDVDLSQLDYSGQYDPIWTDLAYYDNKLIGLTEQNEMWIGTVDVDTTSGSIVIPEEDIRMVNYPTIPDPPLTPDFDRHLAGMGDLSLSIDERDTRIYRIQLAYAFVGEYGPTKVSGNFVFYANMPVSEWHAGAYLKIVDMPIPQPPEGSDFDTYNIKAVEIYYSTDNAMGLLFAGRVELQPTDTTWSYSWLGYVDATSMWPIANLIAPTENYTNGVPASRMTVIDGRMYFWGDKSEPQRLYIGGNPGNLLSTSPGTGGGFIDVEPGTHQSVKHVCKYKTQSGNSIVTMLCDSPNSHREQRFNLVENSISLSNEQSMKSWQAEQVAGAVGCKSYDGAVVCQDGLYSVSRYGLALTTMTMEYNSQIRTTYVSDPIKTVFTDAVDMDVRLSNAMLIECDGIIYMALGAASDEDGNLDNVIFCYDIDLKAWWTVTLDVDEPILNLFHMDYQGRREGIGIITPSHIYMLPTTVGDLVDYDEASDHSFLIETAELSTQMPQQGWQYLSQIEFHFDYLVGDITIEVRMVDMFGRFIKARKVIDEESMQYNYTTWMRIDQRVMSYVITITGNARFRMTHFIARVYTLSNKIGQVWGFDDSISHRTSGSVHPTFKCYNDIRKAIFT